MTEANISKTLKNLCKNRTTVVVAHKLSSIEDADRIFVMDDGYLCEAGTHSELMRLQGHYFNLVKAQSSSSDELV